MSLPSAFDRRRVLALLLGAVLLRPSVAWADDEDDDEEDDDDDDDSSGRGRGGDDEDRDEDDEDRSGNRDRGDSSRGGQPSAGLRDVTVLYPDGWVERIDGGVYELVDPRSRQVVRRAATAEDVARMLALR